MVATPWDALFKLRWCRLRCGGGRSIVFNYVFFPLFASFFIQGFVQGLYIHSVVDFEICSCPGHALFVRGE